jgi:rhodanese-related sulfurtransferase
MIDQIHASEFKTWLSTQSLPVTVLDVREDWEVQTASIKVDGFELKHLPMNETPARVAELAVSSAIACLCHHGARSQRVAQFLVQNGFSNVVNIAGGIAAWSQAADSTVPQY